MGMVVEFDNIFGDSCFFDQLWNRVKCFKFQVPTRRVGEMSTHKTADFFFPPFCFPANSRVQLETQWCQFPELLSFC